MNKLNFSKKLLQSGGELVNKIRDNHNNLNKWLECFSTNISIYDLSELNDKSIQTYFGLFQHDESGHQIFINLSNHADIAFEIFFHELMHAYLKEVGFPDPKTLSVPEEMSGWNLDKFASLVTGAIEHRYVYITMKEGAGFLNLKLYFSKSIDQKIDRAKKGVNKVSNYFSQDVLDIISYSAHFFDYEKRLKNFLRNHGQQQCIEEAEKIIREFNEVGELSASSVSVFNEILRNNLSRISIEKKEQDVWRYCGLEF